MPQEKCNKPDFEALRKARNASVQKMIEEVARRNGWDSAKTSHNFDFDACYCACISGGPCEHNFQGWRDIADGNGQEAFCSRCGMGAMSHTLRTAE